MAQTGLAAAGGAQGGAMGLQARTLASAPAIFAFLQRALRPYPLHGCYSG